MRKEGKSSSKDKTANVFPLAEPTRKQILEELSQEFENQGGESHVEPDTLVLVNDKTGELREVAHIYTQDQEAIARKANKNLAKRMSFFITISLRDLELLPRLTSDEYKLLGYLKCKIYMNSRVYKFTIMDAHPRVGLSYERCRKAYHGLIDKFIIIRKFDKASGKDSIIVDPTISFKGTFTNQYRSSLKFQAELEKLRKLK